VGCGDGSFWMSWGAFIAVYNRLQICWAAGLAAREDRAGGGSSAADGRVNPSVNPQAVAPAGGVPLVRIECAVSSGIV